METKQVVPDFLQQFKPEDDKLDFEDDSDEEEDTENEVTAPAADTNGTSGHAAWK
jgi:hypothetical protein